MSELSEASAYLKKHRLERRRINNRHSARNSRARKLEVKNKLEKRVRKLENGLEVKKKRIEYLRRLLQSIKEEMQDLASSVPVDLESLMLVDLPSEFPLDELDMEYVDSILYTPPNDIDSLSITD